MTYKESDWLKACGRLQSSRAAYEAVMQLDKKARGDADLDLPIISCWMFGEYAINAALEALGLRVPQDHSQPAKSKDLFQQGSLSKDYSGTLEKLERFRKKASHLGYAKERATHYSTADLLVCLNEMEELRKEVEALLKSKGKLTSS